jgi:hypothetical protein
LNASSWFGRCKPKAIREWPWKGKEARRGVLVNKPPVSKWSFFLQVNSTRMCHDYSTWGVNEVLGTYSPTSEKNRNGGIGYYQTFLSSLGHWKSYLLSFHLTDLLFKIVNLFLLLFQLLFLFHKKLCFLGYFTFSYFYTYHIFIIPFVSYLLHLDSFQGCLSVYDVIYLGK